MTSPVFWELSQLRVNLFTDSSCSQERVFPPSFSAGSFLKIWLWRASASARTCRANQTPWPSCNWQAILMLAWVWLSPFSWRVAKLQMIMSWLSHEGGRVLLCFLRCFLISVRRSAQSQTWLFGHSTTSSNSASQSSISSSWSLQLLDPSLRFHFCSHSQTLDSHQSYPDFGHLKPRCLNEDHDLLKDLKALTLNASVNPARILADAVSYHEIIS